jgi:hypothetical protein
VPRKEGQLYRLRHNWCWGCNKRTLFGTGSRQ